ncbi:unnamed protein product [Orchesella dallaii]|uniref:Uncharacterized protein n=1 Tax=Orchesella dallaii TaxID=48710 RepID=A0ABP1RKI7_9HEXA
MKYHVGALEKDSSRQGSKMPNVLSKEVGAYMDGNDVCSGCRCGYLGCDCALCCVACKDRIRLCYCWWYLSYAGFRCESCVYFSPACICDQEFRCRYCVVSLIKCRRGGCIRYLPKLSSDDAKPYIELFHAEEGPIDDEPEGNDYDSVISLNGLAINDDENDEIPSASAQPTTCDSLGTSPDRSLGGKKKKKSVSSDSGNGSGSWSDDSNSP